MNVSDKFFWIINHPKLTCDGKRQADIELTPQMVNPITKEIDSFVQLNTKLEWWVEVTHYEMHDGMLGQCHDWDLDTGGNTAEEAIENCYSLVLKKFGAYSEGGDA